MASLLDGGRLAETVVVWSVLGAVTTWCAWLLTPPGRQPDEAAFRGALSVWVSLLVAAAVDLCDAKPPGLDESTFVLALVVIMPLVLWVPYLWRRWRVLPHATAWTLAAVSMAPYLLGIVVSTDSALKLHMSTASLRAISGLGAAVSMLAALCACAFAVRRLPSSAGLVVITATGALMGGLLLEMSRTLPAAAAWAVALAVWMTLIYFAPKAATWRALLCMRGVALLPLAVIAGAIVGILLTFSGRALVQITVLAGFAALEGWWVFVHLEKAPIRAAREAALRGAVAGILPGLTGAAVLATAVLAVFLGSALAFDRSSAQVLATLRSAGLAAFSEAALARVFLQDEYLWRGTVTPTTDARRPTSPLEFWAMPEFDRWSWAATSKSVGPRNREVSEGTGLMIALQGRSGIVVVAPEGSPGYALGVRRGDHIVLEKEDQIGSAPEDERTYIGPAHDPITVAVAVRGGGMRTVQVPGRPHPNRRIVQTATLDASGRLVGYIALQQFDAIAEREFTEAISTLRAKGVRTLVLDLRYNPGGDLLSTAGIAGAIVGDAGRGKTFVRTHHNARYRDRDGPVAFRVPANGGLDAEQLVVITSPGTCSASELLVKGLEPYLAVATVGTPSCGKPVGSSRVEAGDWTYGVISFSVRNARGEGEYFEGLPPTCKAMDDVAHELGDPREASLREALQYLATGRCSEPAA